MSTEETDKSDVSVGDDEEEWLYGDEEQLVDQGAPGKDVSSSLPREDQIGKNEVAKQSGTESESESDDDDVCVTIGDIQTSASLTSISGSTPVTLNIKTLCKSNVAGGKLKGVDLQAAGSVNGTPVLELELESLEDKPWRKPGADLSDYFNYGFNEETWKAYCEKQRRLRMNLEVMTQGPSSGKIMVHHGRDFRNDKSDYSSPSSVHKSAFSSSSSSRVSCGSISVIGGQTGTINRVEGRRRHGADGNNIQVVTPEAELVSFFPPNIPPPPLPPLGLASTPPLIPPHRLPINIPPPGFPLPPGVPAPPVLPSLDRLMRYWCSKGKREGRHNRRREGERESSHSPISCRSHSGRSGSSEGRPALPFPFPAGVFPAVLEGMGVWPEVVERGQAWESYTRRERERERARDREKERVRERGRERERDREQSLSSQTNNSDEERTAHRDRGSERHRERRWKEGEREDRHRSRHHETRHTSSHSRGSRRRHDSDEVEGHRRPRHKHSRRHHESREPSPERHADQENQSEATD